MQKSINPVELIGSCIKMSWKICKLQPKECKSVYNLFWGGDRSVDLGTLTPQFL